MKTFPPRKIAVAFDWSEPSLTALQTAKTLARRWKAFLDVVYIFDAPPAYGPAGEAAFVAPSQWKSHNADLRAKIKKDMTDVKAASYKFHILEGDPATNLNRWTRRHKTDILVTGTHGYTGFSHALFGSVAESLVSGARVSVLSVHAGKPLSAPRRVLIPFNQTDYGAAALAAGLRWCAAFKALPTVFQVVENPEEEVAAYVLLNARVAPLMKKSKIAKFELLTRSGDPIRSILEEARFGKHDMVVLAAHHKSFWKDLVLGTTAERVLRLCPSPVLSFVSKKGA